MSKIFVRSIPGRVSRIEPKGRYLPYDKFIPTLMSPYAARRIAHGDWEVRESAPNAPKSTRGPKEQERSVWPSTDENAG